ncbi:DUF2971 domain-containing protein [Neptunomonas concharum]|uniref:DUF2971 domain-containing protein n=1 Tax=Neptunomonas concharum TaxID=1031538 RepID=A0A5P1R9J4_9GAMM|nr:DUF2971 domain-containing protein [Neptunomonas concharum]QEQ96273.1 DUF2971 domain-containing protein [Neptunomonas concharum]
MKKKPRFYKYKSLDNFEFLLDLLLKERMYAAPYHELNDPMEGVIKIDGTISKEREAEWESLIKETRLVCFTKSSTNPLMWSHYADGGRGCVVCFELMDKQIFHKVSYLKKPSITEKDLLPEKALQILQYKDKHWKYEAEYRCLIQNESFLPVDIKSITFGPRADKNKVDMLSHILRLCKPKLGVFKMNDNGLVEKPEIITGATITRMANQQLNPDYCPKCSETEIIQNNYVGRNRNWVGF